MSRQRLIFELQSDIHVFLPDRVMFNGTRGRLELDVVESTHRTAGESTTVGGAIHGTASAPNPGDAKVTLHPLWSEPIPLPVKVDHAAHGGGDTRMLNVLFGPKKGSENVVDDGDACQQRADQKAGTAALALGLMANKSFAENRMVSIDEFDFGA